MLQVNNTVPDARGNFAVFPVQWTDVLSGMHGCPIVCIEDVMQQQKGHNNNIFDGTETDNILWTIYALIMLTHKP